VHVEKAKPEIQLRFFLQGPIKRLCFLQFLFIKVEYQQNNNIINDVIDYLLCSVLSNELFIKIISLLLVLLVRYRMQTKCAFKRFVK